MDTKNCSICHELKPLGDFSPDKRASTGRQPACRQCVNEKKKAAHALNPEINRGKRKKYYQANRERLLRINSESRARNAESVKAGKQRYYEKVKHDPDFQQKMRGYTRANRERKRAYDREYARRPGVALRATARARKWAQENPLMRKAVVKTYSAKRRALTRQGMSSAQLLEWTQATQKKCYWCGDKCPDDYHVDHYIPLSKGGTHEEGNLVIACPTCNLRKNAKDPYDFAQEVGRLF